MKKEEFGMKKTKIKEKKWQLLRVRTREERLDLSEKDFLSVGMGAFRGQKSPEEVILPASVSAIKHRAFAGCGHLFRVEVLSQTDLQQMDSACPSNPCRKNGSFLCKDSGKQS